MFKSVRSVDFDDWIENRILELQITELTKLHAFKWIKLQQNFVVQFDQLAELPRQKTLHT